MVYTVYITVYHCPHITFPLIPGHSSPSPPPPSSQNPSAHPFVWSPVLTRLRHSNTPGGGRACLHKCCPHPPSRHISHSRQTERHHYVTPAFHVKLYPLPHTLANGRALHHPLCYLILFKGGAWFDVCLWLRGFLVWWSWNFNCLGLLLIAALSHPLAAPRGRQDQELLWV